MQAQNVQIKFDILLRGEQAIKGAKKSVIVASGLTRGGKSCFCNFLLNKPMVGKDVEGDVIYIPASSDGSYAKMSNQFASMTLDPNVYPLYSTTSLLDMAGSGENRSAANIMLISYFLSILFQTVENIKFILIFSEQVVIDNNFRQMINTFNEFINLFNFPHMPAAIKSQILASVSFVVTRSRKKQDYYLNRFIKVAKELEKEDNLGKVQNKSIIIDLIEHITTFNRVYVFEQAEEGVATSKANVIEKWNEAGWKYLNLVKAKAELRTKSKELMILPFQRDFRKLTESEQTAFKKFLNRRNQAISKGLTSLIEVYIEELRSNWKKVQLIKNQSPKFQSIALKSELFFSNVKTFLSTTYSDYKSDALVENLSFSKTSEVPLLSVIESTLRMKDTFSRQMDSKATIVQKLDHTQKELMGLLSYMGAVCQSQNEFKQFQRVAFVIKRIIKENITFQNIHKQMVSDIYYLLRDRVVNPLENCIIYIKEVMTSYLLLDFLTTIKDLEHMERLTEQYMKDFSQNLQFKKMPQQYKSNYFVGKIRLYEAKFRIGSENSPSIALHHCIALLNQLIDSISELKRLKSSDLIKSLELKKIKFTQTAAFLLLKCPPGSHPKRASIAIELSQLARSPHLTDCIFNQALNQSQTDTRANLDFMQRYANFLLKWGRVEEAVRVFWELRERYLQQQNQQGLQIVAKELINIQKNKQINYYSTNYSRLLNQLNVPFNDAKDKELASLCSQIRQKLSLNSQVSNEDNQMWSSSASTMKSSISSGKTSRVSTIYK